MQGSVDFKAMHNPHRKQYAQQTEYLLYFHIFLLKTVLLFLLLLLVNSHIWTIVEIILPARGNSVEKHYYCLPNFII